MKKNFLLAAAIVGILLSGNLTQAQTSYPMLMSLQPVAAQIGQASEHTISSRYSMRGAYRVFVTGQGVTGEIIHPEEKEKIEKKGEKKDDKKKDDKKEDKKEPPKKVKKPDLTKMKIRFTIAADAKPGVRDFRIATPQGVSTLGQLVIVRDSVIVESAKNDTADLAQQVTLPATLCGCLERGEDVDYFKFKATPGQTLNFHVRCMRLQDRIHDLQKHADPIITIKNAMGSTLASSDNYFYGDPFLGYTFEQEGEYLLEIRDVRYQGNAFWQYSIEVSDQPFISNVHPLGVTAGKQAKLQLIGHHLPPGASTTLDVPGDLSPGQHWLPLMLNGKITNPVPVVVNELQAILESSADNNDLAKGQPVNLPVGISGRIESENDLDYYTFTAKKGEKYSFETIARRQQSALDPHLRILAVKDSKQLALTDDMSIDKRRYADSLIANWTVPADGQYAVEIRDVHLRGGPAYVYFLKITKAKPSFQLFVDTDKTQLTPGTCGVIFVRVLRENGFKGEVQLAVTGLPKGVKASCGKILPLDMKGSDGCIILEAASDAKPAISNITITGTSEIQIEEGKAKKLSAVAQPYQETYMPGGGRGHWLVEMHTVSVAAPNDILGIELSQNEIELKPGESKKIGVTIKRSENYTKNITLDVLYRHLSGVYGNALPLGVTLDSKNSKTLLTGKSTEGEITLTAADDAQPVEKQQISVMANISLNFVMKTTYSSKPLLITVAKPPEEKVAKTETPQPAKK